MKVQRRYAPIIAPGQFSGSALDKEAPPLLGGDKQQCCNHRSHHAIPTERYRCRNRDNGFAQTRNLQLSYN